MSRLKPFYSPKSRPLDPNRLGDIYRILRKYFGPQHWWPGDTPFEVMIGAILTQNTAWTNVEKAIRNLKLSGVLHPKAIMQMTAEHLASLIRPAGYFNIKAKRIRNFVGFYLAEYGGCLQKMKDENIGLLREKLLSVNGIGKETADSIILYAAEKPIFVIDAYTKRIFSRHRIKWKRPGNKCISSPAVLASRDYDDWQLLFANHVPRRRGLYNDFHAQIVALGKSFCLSKKPRCQECPLKVLL